MLPAGGDPLDVQDMVAAFAQLGTRRLIVGKLDVAKRYGGMMAALFNSPLHLVAFSNSPYVADPFVAFTAEALAHTLLQSTPLYEGNDLDDAQSVRMGVQKI